MSEPETEVKDADGYSWVPAENGGWNLKNHDQPCYLNVPWKNVVKEYGPITIIGR